MTRATLRRAAGLAALAAGAALYFSRTIDATLEWLDEGMIVHPIWRASLGDVPFVDFQNIYGPSHFVLNGVLFRVFGPDLHVLRLVLVALKALVAVEVYLLARRVAPVGVALLVAAFLVVVWGTPIWLFNAPYAVYYTTPLCLAGLLAIAGGRRTPARLFVAGLAFGCAATFKHTQALFVCLSVGLAVLFGTRGGSRTRFPASGRALAGVLRLLVVAGAAGVALSYVAAHLHTATAALLVLPLCAGCAALAAAELRAWPPGDAAVAAVPALAWLGAGMAVPLLATAAVYAARGALAALVFNLLSGLPQRISWFVPLQRPTLQTVAFGVFVLSTFGVLAVWRRWLARPEPRTAADLVAALTALGGAALVVALRVDQGMGLRAYVLGGFWPQEFYLLLPWLPYLLLALATMSLLRRPDAPEAPDVALFTCLAAGALLQLHPAADLPHAMMTLPAFLPLLAHALTRVVAADGEGRTARAAAWVLVIVWPLAAGVPYVRSWLAVGWLANAQGGSFARASGVTGGTPKATETAELVRALPALAGPGGTMLVLSEERLLYFLADVPSALPREEFVLYLVNGDIVRDEDARLLADEDAMIRTLRARRPLVVEDTTSAAAARVRRAFPRLAAFLDDTYAPARTIGRYRIRLPR